MAHPVDFFDVAHQLAVDKALAAAGVTEQAIGTVAAQIFQAGLPAGDLPAYLENLRGTHPWHFTTVPTPAAMKDRPSDAVSNAYMLVHAQRLAGAPTPPPATPDATRAPQQISRSSPDFARQFAAHAAQVASGKTAVVP